MNLTTSILTPQLALYRVDRIQMKTHSIAILLCLLLSSTSAVWGQSGKNPAEIAARLSSTNTEARVSALQSLGELGSAANSESKTVEKCLSDRDFKVAVAASRALVSIQGPEQATKTFAVIIQDSAQSSLTRAVALIGLEKCGSLALPIIGWSINDRDPGVRYQAVTTAIKIDLEGTLNDRILPMLAGEPDNVTHAVRKYVLAQGILRFKAKEGRWPTDFREAHEFIRKSNPLINLDPMTKSGEVKFVVQADGSLKVGGYFTLPK
jgi:hypothetical protein